jgi:hypothetical protein
LTVDATKLAPGNTLTVDSVAGRTLIQNLPPNTPVTVNARVLAGQICVNDKDVTDGVSASVSHEFGTGAQPITVNVHQVFGQILVSGTGCNR